MRPNMAKAKIAFIMLIPVISSSQPRGHYKVLRTTIGSSLRLGHFAAIVPDINHCDPIETLLNMEQDSFLTQVPTTCAKGPHDKGSCTNIPDGVEWHIPLGFTFTNVSMNIGGKFDLDIKCNGSSVAKKKFLIIVQGFPVQPDISIFHGNGQNIFLCNSTSTTRPEQQRLPLEFTWKINGQAPATQGYRVEFVGKAGQEMILTEERWIRRCDDHVQCSVTEMHSHLENSATLVFGREGFFLAIDCDRKQRPQQLECRPVLSSNKEASAVRKPATDFKDLKWFINSNDVNPMNNSHHNLSGDIMVQVTGASLTIRYPGGQDILIVCEVIDECNRTKTATMQLKDTKPTIGYTQTESSVSSSVISMSTGHWFVWFGSLLGVILLAVIVALVYIKCRKKRSVSNMTGELSSRCSDESGNAKSCGDVYHTVRESQVFPEGAVVEVRTLTRELWSRRTTAIQATPGDGCPDLPARGDTYDPAFCNEQSVTQSTPPPQRPPSRGNMDEYKTYIQTTDFKDHVYD